MFITIIILLLPFLMIAFLPATLKSFSSDELDQMGVQLDDSGTPTDPVQRPNCIRPTMKVACSNA